jgi:tetratricopeptide (TPR) repeat protein
MDDIASRQLALHQLDRAKTSYERALAIHNALDGLDPQFAAVGRAGILHQLGMVAQEQRRFEEAETAYKQALAIQLEFNDRRTAARTYHELGRVAEEQHRFEDAEAAYKQALAIQREFNDRHSAASTYHQLGIVAQEQRRFEEAETAYKQALAIKLEFNDRHSAASTYHQLGMIAEEQRRFEEAEAAYKQALEIFVTFGDEQRRPIVLLSLARLWRLTQFASIPAAVATTLNIDPTEAEALLQKFSPPD